MTPNEKYTELIKSRTLAKLEELDVRKAELQFQKDKDDGDRQERMKKDQADRDERMKKDQADREDRQKKEEADREDRKMLMDALIKQLTNK